MKNWPLFVILGVVALLGALIVYAIETHKEPGLQKACVLPPQRVATYYEAACVGLPMREIKWADEIPVIRVRADLSADDFQAEALRQTVRAVNTEMGFAALSYGRLQFNKPIDESEVIVFFNSPPGAGMPHEGGTTTHYFNDHGRVTSAVVYVYNTPLADELGAVLAHEMGHVLGLAHDPFESSVMHSPPPMPWHFTDDDVKLIRSLRER